jgi:3-oxoacyl-(acyl-carrier-protein) synthase
MLAGSTEGASPYTWGPFDSMRILSSRFNDQPHKGSRPMSASAGGFVPGGGSGILFLESLDIRSFEQSLKPVLVLVM